MEKKNGFLKRLWEIMNEPRFEKPLMILIPFLTLLICAMILLPRLLGLTDGDRVIIQDDPVVVQDTAIQAEAEPVSTAQPTPSPTPSPKGEIITGLRGNSVDRDLYITVCGADGRPIKGEVFSLAVTYPDGQTYGFDTEEDGSCYLVRLAPGEYKVELNEKKGYVKAEAISCTVSASAQYAPIEDIQTAADVKDVTEVSASEKPDQGYTPAEVIAEEIRTPDPTPTPIPSEAPVPEPEPEPVGGEVIVIGGEIEPEPPAPVITYRYRFRVSANGYLILSETGEESDVMAMDEDGDGSPEFGLRFIPEEKDEEGNVTSEAYSVSVEIFNADGSPVNTYDYETIEVVTEPEPTPTPEPTLTPEPTPTPAADPGTVEIINSYGWREIDGKTYYYYEDGNYAVGLKKIDGKFYYFNTYGVKASSVGIDVSFYNNDINWNVVKAQGIDFAIIRVGGRGWSSGALYDDVRTQEYLRGARAAGVKIGVYFYSTAITNYEAVEEASVAISTLGGMSLDYPIFIDMEFSGEYPYGRSDQLSASQRGGIATAFCETVRNAGYRAGVYSGQNFYKYSMDYNAISSYYIWLASYTSNNRLPDFPYRYDMWQFTDRAAVDGIQGGVDMDVIF